MLNEAYGEVAADGQGEARHQESLVISRSVELMIASDERPDNGTIRIDAINFTTRVWSHLLNDLASADNQYADELKASLISIGIFIMKHVDLMRKDRNLRFRPVREVSQLILEGMK